MKPVLANERFSLKTNTKSRTIPPDEFLTTRELMRLLKIKHKQTVYGLIESGLPTIMVGKSYRFIKGEVIEFFRQHRNHKRVPRHSIKR